MNACSPTRVALFACSLIAVSLASGSAVASTQWMRSPDGMLLQLPTGWVAKAGHGRVLLTDPAHQVLAVIQSTSRLDTDERAVAEFVAGYCDEVHVEREMETRPVEDGKFLFFTGTGSLPGVQVEWSLGIGVFESRVVTLFALAGPGTLRRLQPAINAIADRLRTQ